MNNSLSLSGWLNMYFLNISEPYKCLICVHGLFNSLPIMLGLCTNRHSCYSAISIIKFTYLSKILISKYIAWTCNVTFGIHSYIFTFTLKVTIPHSKWWGNAGERCSYLSCMLQVDASIFCICSIFNCLTIKVLYNDHVTLILI